MAIVQTTYEYVRYATRPVRQPQADGREALPAYIIPSHSDIGDALSEVPRILGKAFLAPLKFLENSLPQAHSESMQAGSDQRGSQVRPTWRMPA